MDRAGVLGKEEEDSEEEETPPASENGVLSLVESALQIELRSEWFEVGENIVWRCCA